VFGGLRTDWHPKTQKCQQPTVLVQLKLLELLAVCSLSVCLSVCPPSRIRNTNTAFFFDRLNSHSESKFVRLCCLYRLYRILIFSVIYLLSLPAAAPSRVWAVARVGWVDTINKPTGCGRRQLSGKIMTL
jgi:hypothetical protein